MFTSLLAVSKSDSEVSTPALFNSVKIWLTILAYSKKFLPATQSCIQCLVCKPYTLNTLTLTAPFSNKTPANSMKSFFTQCQQGFVFHSSHTLTKGS